MKALESQEDNDFDSQSQEMIQDLQNLLRKAEVNR